MLGLFPGGAEAFWAIISRKLSKLRMVISLRPAGMAMPASAKASRMPSQIGADSAVLGDVADECVERESDIRCSEIVERDRRRRRCQHLWVFLRDRKKCRLHLPRVAAIGHTDRDADAADVVAERPVFHLLRDEIRIGNENVGPVEGFQFGGADADLAHIALLAADNDEIADPDRALSQQIITRTLAPEALDSWGWRIPFLLGLIIDPVRLFIRRHLQETDAFLEASGGASGRPNFSTTLVTHVKQVLVCMGIVTSGTISFYVILLYMPTFARVQLHLPLDQAFIAQAISLTCMIVITPLSGLLSDLIGRKPIMIAALSLHFVLVYPLFGFRGGGGRGGGRRSDVRLKHDIVLLGRLDNGLGLYRFSYNGSKVYVGVLAQEAQQVMPQAVAQGTDGYNGAINQGQHVAHRGGGNAGQRAGAQLQGATRT